MAENELNITVASEDFINRRKKYRKKEKWWENIAIPFVMVTTVAISLTGTIALHLLIPAIPIGALIAMGFSGLLVDGLMYWGDVRKTFALFYGRGLFRDLHDYIIGEYLFSKIKKAISKNKNIEGLLTADDRELLKNQLDEIAKKEYLNTAEKTKEKLIKKRKNTFLRKFINDIITYWRTSNKKSPLNENQDILNQGVKYINQIVLPQTKNEYLAKRILSALGVSVGLISGFAFGCIVFTHLMQLGFAGIAIFGGIIGVIAGISFAKLMFKTLYTMVKKNVFKQIWNKLGLTKPKERSWSEHIGLTLLHLIPALIVIAIGLTATILLAGSLVDASVEFLSLFFAESAPQGVIIATQVLLLGVLLPVKSVFAINHSLGAVSKICAAVKQRIAWIRDKNTSWHAVFEDVKKNPLHTVLYVAAVCIIGALSLFHFIADAAYGAGEGATAENSWPSHAFQSITNALHVNANDAGLAAATVSEGLEHGDFVLGQGGKLADAIAGEKKSDKKDNEKQESFSSKVYSYFFSEKEDKFGYSELTTAVLSPPDPA